MLLSSHKQVPVVTLTDTLRRKDVQDFPERHVTFQTSVAPSDQGTIPVSTVKQRAEDIYTFPALPTRKTCPVIKAMCQRSSHARSAKVQQHRITTALHRVERNMKKSKINCTTLPERGRDCNK